MSSASTNGSGTSPAGRATSPPRIGPRKKLSLKFWLKKLERRIVRSAPTSCTARSARWASSSPRPERSTSRRTPLLHREGGQGTDGLDGPWHREVRVVGDVNRSYVAQ